ncbi:MAG: hypothetical protein J6V10_09285 [Clostridia bacterium]|jgi:hypothetical protein|nr:hypothetical protein [Clostridia bacterium]
MMNGKYQPDSFQSGFPQKQAVLENSAIFRVISAEFSAILQLDIALYSRIWYNRAEKYSGGRYVPKDF